MWSDPWQENWLCVSGWGGDSKGAEWKQVVAREKSKFEIKQCEENRK